MLSQRLITGITGTQVSERDSYLSQLFRFCRGACLDIGVNGMRKI